MRRWACAAALALLLAPVAGAADTTGPTPTTAGTSTAGDEHHRYHGTAREQRSRRLRRGAVRPVTRHGPADEERRHRRVPGPSQGRPLARALSAETADRCDVRQGDAAVDGDGVVGSRGRDRPREGRRCGRARDRGVHRPSGRVGDGARAGRLVRRQDPQRLVDVDGAQRHLLPRARRPAPDPLVAHGRPAGAALLRVLAAVLQPRPHLHERVARGAAARVPRRPHVVDRLPRPPREPGSLVARLAARGARRLPRRAADRSQPRDAARGDRRRLRGRDRRRPDPRPPGTVRPHAGHRGPRVRPGRLRRSDPGPHPDERPLRIRQRSWRHLRADRLPRLRPGRARVRLVGEVGLAAGRPRDGDRLRPAGRSSACSSSVAASAARRSERRSPSAGSRSPSPPTR